MIVFEGRVWLIKMYINVRLGWWRNWDEVIIWIEGGVCEKDVKWGSFLGKLGELLR